MSRKNTRSCAVPLILADPEDELFTRGECRGIGGLFFPFFRGRQAIGNKRRMLFLAKTGFWIIQIETYHRRLHSIKDFSPWCILFVLNAAIKTSPGRARSDDAIGTQ